MLLTAGQAADSPRFIPVLNKVRVRGPAGRPRTRPEAVAGDKAYSSRGNRAYLRKRRIKAVIREKGPSRPPEEEGQQGRQARQSRHRALQGTEHRRARDQQAEGMARHRHTLRQDPGKLPRRPPPPRLNDLDQGPHTNHPSITTKYAP
ncbi:transposase [Streptomyces sp. RGM 3693]|uniref:transposase n=1 Tax=Streptomyces sp. RGM 3693 TaxID=3413284 RepID=UPI003D2E70EE